MAGIAVEMELHHSNPIQYFNHLKAFYYVALCESFTRAAEKLSLSQSTLSIQVQSLEQQLGFPLIKQNKRRIELTEADAGAWLTAVNDIRLALGTMLDVGPDGPHRLPAGHPMAGHLDVYQWLTVLQEYLVLALMDKPLQ